MRTAAGASAVLATGQAIMIDLVTLTIPRRWYLADGTLVEAPAVARWTSHDRSVRFGGNVFRGLSGTVWSRGKRVDTSGAELAQFEATLVGSLLVDWRTSSTDANQVDQIELAELAALGLLEQATLQVDVAILAAWPTSPEASIDAGSVLTSQVLVEIQEGNRDGWMVSMKGASVLQRGNASVPRSVISPMCRWEYGSVQCLGSAAARPLEAATIVGVSGERVVLSTTLSDYMNGWRVLIPLAGRNLGVPRLIGEKLADGANWSYRVSEPFPWSTLSGAAVVLRQCTRMWSSSLERPAGDGCLQFGNGSRFGGFPFVPASEDA